VVGHTAWDSDTSAAATTSRSAVGEDRPQRLAHPSGLLFGRRRLPLVLRGYAQGCITLTGVATQ
jgi:hypothetical protein